MKTGKKILCLFLAVMLLIGSAPLSGLTGIELPWASTKAQAAGVAGYSPLAAVQWAKDHWNDTTSVLFGRGYWEKGTGDCANFVSQCLYMGGIDMNSSWNTNGYKAHYSSSSGGAFIRAQQLYDYVCKIGGTSIQNPSASQVEVGDLLFYWKPGGSRINHSAIVIDIVDNTPKIAYHSDSDSSGNAIKKVTTDWHCGRSGSQTYLVKMNGAPCVSPNPRSFDVYTVGNSTTYLYKSASTSSTKLSTYKSGEYTHVYDTKTVSGVSWGYTQRYGTWGWVKLNLLNYQRKATSGITSHLLGDWYTTKKATCVSSGEERRDCQRCDYYETKTITAGGHVVTKKATCTEDGYCDLCGALAQQATGHKWDNGVVSPDATCVNYGVKTYTCQNDSSHTYTVTLPTDPNKHSSSTTLINQKDATCVDSGYTGDRLCPDCGVVVEKGSEIKPLGHSYVITASLPTCTQSGIITKKCSRCSAMRSEYADENNTWSDWTTEVITGLPSSKVQSKTQYRYSDKSTTSSYETSLSGWTQSGSTWVQSDSGTIDYVASFPSGFSTSHSLYSQYNKSPVSASESSTNKTTVSTSTLGYIYWHWCRGDSQGNINRKINDSYTSKYPAFHAFFSTTQFTYKSAEKSFTVGKGNSYGGCEDTYWWISTASGSSSLLEVKRCSYTNYRNLFYYYKWSDWSGWQDSYVASSDTRQVETRTLYKYDLAALGHDFSVEGAYKAPTCTEAGYSGSVCSRCGAISENTTVIPALGHLLYDSPVYESTKEELSASGQTTPLGYWYRTSASTDTKKVYHRDCARSCGYGEDREENCVYVLTKEINANCTEDGKKIFTCTLHGETKESVISATGHNWGEWFTTKPATCESQGNSMRVCQNDESHIENKDIPALGHTLTKIDAIEPKCETKGNSEYYVCDVCDKIFRDSEGKTEISIDDTIIEPLGHSGLDKNGNEVWERITEPKCGETGYERMLCQREFDGEKCNHLIDEREIPGLEPIYKEISRVEPTCAELGLIEYTCTRCEGTDDAHGYIEDIDKIEHPWGEDIKESATCTGYGRIYHVCSYCGEEELIEELEPLGHIEGDKITIYATCTKDGYTYWECQREGCDYSEVTAEYTATGHSFKSETKNSTCIENGYTVHTCTNINKNTNEVCSYNYTDGDNSALGHDLGEWYTVTKATCLADGLERSDCSRCDYYVTRVIPATGHSLDTTSQAPTCTEDGYELTVCKNEKCSYREYEVLNATGHDYVEKDIIPATCTEVEGVHMVCANDPSHTYLKRSDTEPLGHDFSEKIIDEAHLAKAATCTEAAVYYYDCARTGDSANNGVACDTIGDKTFVYAEPLGHDYGSWVDDENGTTHTKTCQRDNCTDTVKEHKISANHNMSETKRVGATCLEDGYIKYDCSDCDYTYNETLKALGHDYGAWVDDENGTTHTKTCQRDNCTDTVKEHKISANHNMSETKRVEATCLEDGYIKYDCSDCDYTYNETLKATGHDYGSWIENGDGTHTKTCANDSSHTVTEDCNFGEWTTTVAPKCTEKGEKERTCADCGYVEKGEVPATGHDWDEGKIDPKSTCNTHGTKTYTCKNDSTHTYTEEVPLDENNHVGETYLKDNKAAKCTEDGYTGDTYCSDCDKLLKEGSVIPALNHDYGKWVDDKNGTTHTKTCKRENCTDTVTEHKVSANHNMSETDRQEATCLEDGYIKYDCSDCDYTYTETLKATGHDWGEWIITKEPTYDDTGMKKQICQNDSSHVNWEILPVITKDSEKNENVETNKTVDYDALTGEAVIRLTASSNGEKIVTKSRTPLDIVLVLDQSGSMAGEPSAELKKAATTFVNSIYADATDNNLDHRIAMVGFAMQNGMGEDYPKYLNTEILTTGSEPIQYSDKVTNATYKNALVSVNKDNKLNPVLTTAIGNIDAKGATATDLGLDMACKIFSQNENDGTRKRIVVLMSDGVPTYSNASSSEDVENAADHANIKADLLKNTYHADIYSVGLLSALNDRETYGKTYGRNFLKGVASTDTNGNPLYYDCNNASALVENFSKIAEESTIIRSDFDDVTLIDTVSKAFTLTSKQENQLRVDAVEKLGVTNDDITITRFNDGTTQMTIKHITPKKVENGDDIRFVIDFSFSVTANENALVAGSYVTNTDNAGVIVGVKDVYENNFAVPSDNVEEAEGVIYFNINGITYHVLRVHAGDKIEQPEIDLEGKYTFSGWDLPDEITFEGGKYTVDATLTQTAYTVTWVMGDETVTDTYNCGDVIAVPSVKTNSNGDEFASWDKEIPTTMPANDLKFTASYTKHVHEWVTSTTVSEKDQTAYANVYCKKCGASPDQSLSYTIISESGRMQQSQELNLVDAEKIKINVDGSITISLPIPNSMQRAVKIKVYRTEADGSQTDLKATRSGSYVTFTTDHFSEYTLFAVYECDETGNHIDEDCDKFCDICGKTFSFLDHDYVAISIKNATCTEDGYTTYECSKCGDTYQGDKVKAFGHQDADGDGHCDVCGTDVEGASSSCTHLCHNTNAFIRFIWKIVRFFCKLFKIRQYCSCGVKHW